MEPLNESALHSEGTASDSVCIVGYSLRAPNCSAVPEFARALRTGQDLTTSSTRYPTGHLGLPPRQGRIKDSDISSFDASFFRLSHKQAERMDPLIRMLLQVSYEALMDAKINIQSIRGSKTGVYVGHCFSDVSSHYTSSFNEEKTGYELVNGANSMAANRLSFFYDFKGPSFTIDTACSSSLVALHYAVRDIANGEVERAVVAGLSLTLNPHKNASFKAFKMLSPTGHCHVFDERADGYCRSDGVTCIILERGSKGYAMVAGTGTNSDGAKDEGITYPSSTQQARLFAQVFGKSWVSPEQVSYHEAHGTGTIAGDREELAGLSQVYRHPMVIGSVKSNMGHAEGASGLMGLIKILLMYEDQELYPNFGFQQSPHALINQGQFTILKQTMKWAPAACSISSFGFGGSNALAILVPCLSPKPLPQLDTSVPLRQLPFASSKNAGIPSSIHHKYYTIHRALGNQDQFKYTWKEGEWRECPPLVFVCNGQGSQWNCMGRDLMETSSVFRETMERLETETGIPLVDLYQEGSKWMLKEFSTIGIVSFQLGLLAILRDAGIHPDIYLGHSVGELVCSFLAGFASEAEVLVFATVRTALVNLMDKNTRLDVYETRPADGYDYIIELGDGHLDCDLNDTGNVGFLPGKESPTSQSNVVFPPTSIISESSEAVSSCLFVKRNHIDDPVDAIAIESFSMNGQMVVVGCTAAEVETAISELGLKQTRVACFNAPKGQTVSGPSSEVRRLVEYLKTQDTNVFVRELSTDNIAYHGMHMKAFCSWLRRSFGTVKPMPLPASWRSTSRNQTFGTEYLVKNICEPVYFQEAIESLPHGAAVVEIGPASGMLAQIKRTRPDLIRIGLVERDSPSTNARLDKSLQQLMPWGFQEENGEDSTLPFNDGRIHYGERYPRLWDQSTFHVQTWDEFELPQVAEAPQITYDLTRKPWASIRDHVIRGQNLFPAAGFAHALWSVAASHESNIEILGLRIHSPLVISPSVKAVVMRLHKAGSYCELWDDDGGVRYVSGQIQPAVSAPHLPSAPILCSDCDSIDGKYFYPDRRRLGYEYGTQYQILDKITAHSARVRQEPSDWISYIDGLLHLRLLEETCCAYPVGFDRIHFWKQHLSEAPLWVERPQQNTIRNSAVLLEGIRFEYSPLITSRPSIYRETFIEYGDSKDSLDPTLIAALLSRESRKFRVKQPLISPSLNAIVEKLLKSNMAQQDSQSSLVVLADSSEVEDADLLVTVDPVPPSATHCLVARWADIRMYRFGTSWANLPVKTDWEHVVGQLKPFVWLGEGTSGAVASLFEETGGQVRAISYEDTSRSLIGLGKGMRQNYVRENGAHGVWVDVAVDSENDVRLTSGHAMLEVTRPGQLDSLEWVALEPKNFTVRTSVATLNFRDVMRAMGRLKERDLSLGLEFSGVDVASGQRVFGVAKHALSTHCCPLYSFPTPPELSDENAATLPIAYLTVYYALFHKAKMKRGQSVLIHGGTGGVGMVAITLAQKRGLRILTTCSDSKRQYLKEKFGLSDDQIGDSRSDSFVDTVMANTDGRGVDVVLNQLSGSLQVASLRCLAHEGHFCEIGKYDVLQNSPLGQALLAANVSFHVIDLLPLLCDKDNRVLWDQWLADGFAAKEIVPLPVTEFDATQVVDAFRFMSQGKHKGKIVISGLHSRDFVVRKLCPPLRGETHLITGGLGGLGLSIASQLAKDGCRNIVLVGRKGISNGFQQRRIGEMEGWGCNIHVIQANLLRLSTDSAPPPDKIWHAATVYRDMYLSDMTKESWDLVVQTKVQGYQHLRQCWPTAHIVAISSVVAYFGNALQTSYALANASLDAAARRDPRTLSIRLGPLDNVGFITQGTNHRKVFERIPFQIMRVDDVLNGLLHIASKHKSGVFGIYELKKTKNQARSSKVSLRRSVHNMYSIDDARIFMASILGGSPEQYTPTTSLKAAGLDSLSSMEVLHHIQQESGSLKFKSSDITEQFTLQDMVDTVNGNRSTFRLMDDSLPDEEESQTELAKEQPMVAVEVSRNASKKSLVVGKRCDSPLSSPIGIVAIEVYTPTHAISSDILEHHGIQAGMIYDQDAISVWDGQEDSVSMAMNAVAQLVERHVSDPYTIGRLDVCTQNKFEADVLVKSRLVDFLPRDHFDVEVVDTTDYTVALFNALAWCREKCRHAIIITTDADVINMSEGGWRGASAIALLVGPNPWIEIHRERASYFTNIRDSAPHIRTEAQTEVYIESLDYTLDKIRADHFIDAAAFDAFLFQGGLCADFRKKVERHLINQVEPTTSWTANFDHANRMARHMGTTSLYINLLSLLSEASPNSVHHIGLFSYRSGSTAMLFHATVHHERGHSIDLAQVLAKRFQVSFGTLRQVIGSKGQAAVLKRFPGKFYRGLLQNSTEPAYFREGGGWHTNATASPLRQYTPFGAKQLLLTFPSIAAELRCGRQLDQAPSQRFWMGLILVAATCYWVVSIAVFSARARRIFGYGALVFTICCLIHAGAHWAIKSKNYRVRGSATTLAHYVTGVLCFVTYAVLYAIDDTTFYQNWSAVYFGYHLTDNIQIVLFWEEIHPSFRFFYSLHHALGLSVTATWAIVDGTWHDYIILGVMLWLTAEIWQYGLTLYRHFPGNQLSVDTVARLNLVCFGLERAHRAAAYISGLVVSSLDISGFGWFIFVSGVFLDIFDAWFQWRKIRSRHVHRQFALRVSAADIEMGS